jgi:hypothetical protein
VTSNTSPTHPSSVIQWSTSGDNPQVLCPSVTPLSQDHLQPIHQLGDKLSVSSIEPDLASITAQTDVQISSEVRMSLLGSVIEVTASMDRISRDLRRKQQEVKDYMDDLTEDDNDAARVSTVERDLARSLEKRHEFMSGVREYLEEYNAHLEASAQYAWKDSIININAIVKVHAKKIRTKVHQVSPPLHKYKIKLKYIRIPKQHTC